MKTLQITTSSPYEVIIGKGLLSGAGEMIAKVISPCRTVIISDSFVYPIYAKTLRESLENAGFDVIEYIFPAGETSKSTETLINLLEFLAEQKITRKDMITALGGGVTGDLAGFAASIFLRGISFVQIPTTLLSAVDSSVGGKTAVNLKAGKNLVGSFYQPSLVICDCDTFKSLPCEVFAQGVAEAIKYGVICDKDLFEKINRKGIETNITDIVYRCIDIKRSIVEIDEFDKGERQLLNLGHTIGHAIEKCSNFEISHGYAVAIGLCYIARAAAAFNLCTDETAKKIEQIMIDNSLPTSCKYTPQELYEASLTDKKRSGQTITLVIPLEIGKSILYPVPIEQLYDFIKAGADI